MAKFEEYRQPWETGPHWELKREFMEKYKNDYPLDRLLCLAQAYSNIELLHCSYPEPVMREVYQLSCQLQGCKRFREADADLERRKKEKLEMQPRKAGKRSLFDETSSKPFKFIKFCSPQVASNQSKTRNEYDKNSNDSSHCDTRASTIDSRSSVDSDLNKNSISEDKDNNISALPSNNSYVIFSLSHSPDFNLIQKLAAAVPKKSATALESIERGIEVSGLESMVKYVFIRDKTSAICSQFYVGNTLIATGREASEKTAKERAAQYGLEILTNLQNLPNKTLEDIKKELENWKKATNSELIWSEMLSSDFKSKSKKIKSQLSEIEKNPEYSDLHLILSIVEKLFNEKYTKNRNVPDVQKIVEAAAKCNSQMYFFNFGEDPDTPLHLRAFHCDFIIKNIFICQSKASSKKKAKVNASEQCMKLLLNFIENSELQKQQNDQNQVKSLGINFESTKHLVIDTSTNENTNNSSLKGNSISSDKEYFSNSKKDELNKLGHKVSATENCLKYPVADNLPQTQLKTSVASNECDSQDQISLKSEPKLFRINHRLLTNSRHRQLVIYDSSDVFNQYSPVSILNITATRCKKELQYRIEEITMDGSRNCPKMFRCLITLDGEEIGQSQCFTEKEAKSIAAENALQFLQNSVYTIKVKNEIEDSFLISRNHVLNAENPSSVLSESNVGCKMLKMMGWTGGGIGKTSGITEPIVANDHRFGQGLGFSNSKAKERSFRQRVESLLKDYSQANTTSDLIFTAEFNKEERKEIHKLATKYNLTNVSRGKGDQRQLFIGQKFTPMDLLERLIDAGGSTYKYELEDRTSASQ